MRLENCKIHWVVTVPSQLWQVLPLHPLESMFVFYHSVRNYWELTQQLPTVLPSFMPPQYLSWLIHYHFLASHPIPSPVTPLTTAHCFSLLAWVWPSLSPPHPVVTLCTRCVFPSLAKSHRHPQIWIHAWNTTAAAPAGSRPCPHW